MVEGAEIPVAGQIWNKTNMNLYRNVLRLVSDASGTNHLETFDVSDIHNPVAVDHDTFGDGEDLYATLFLDNRAFFVTYFVSDPFHVFAIDDAGNATEKVEYVISGWNSYFRPVFDGTRIIGVGVNDEDGRNVAVSLYDASDLENPDPFVARQEVASTSYSWSEATFDDRAFTVLENAVKVAAADGTEETGLVLLPFRGSDDESGAAVYAAQLFTFSPTTLTQRGLMAHGSAVRRSFSPQPKTAANLSEQALSLFDTRDPDAPVELGRATLSQYFSDFLLIGDYGVRLAEHNGEHFDSFRVYDDEVNTPTAELQVVPLNRELSDASPVATLAVVSSGAVLRVGDHLGLIMKTIWDSGGGTNSGLVQIIDLSTPTSPVMVSQIERESFGYPNHDDYDANEYYWYEQDYSESRLAHPLGSVVVFPTYTSSHENLGSARRCYYYPESNRQSCDDDTGAPIPGCTYRAGNISCTELDQGDEYCNGAIADCTYNDAGGSDCRIVAVDRDTLYRGDCSEEYPERWWQSPRLLVLDLGDPANPFWRDEIALPEDEDDATILASGATLYVNTRELHVVEGDPRPYWRYYLRTIDFADPAAPVISERINIPGVLLRVDGDTIYTADLVYGETVTETTLNRLTVQGGKAFLDATRRFESRHVKKIRLDERGYILVVHEQPWRFLYDGSDIQRLTVLDGTGSLETVSEYDMDTWVSLRNVKNGWAYFSVPDGVLVVDMTEPGAAYAKAHLPMMRWPSRLEVIGDTVHMAAGLYGIHAIGPDTSNLLD
jgi:hypothetical protein